VGFGTVGGASEAMIWPPFECSPPNCVKGRHDGKPSVSHF